MKGEKSNIKSFVADFETTTDPENCYVWAYALNEVNDYSKNQEVIYGTSIEEFLEWCEKEPNHVLNFHNLKFDIQFVIYYLLTHGYEHVEDTKDRKSRTFTTLISNKGQYYSLTIYFNVKGRSVNKITIRDSLKLIPLSVRAIAKAFHLPEGKGSLDYDSHNGIPAGTPLNDDEKHYISQDVRIVSHALNYFYSEGFDKMTIGSCALNEYKKVISEKAFKRYYPTPKFHEDVKQSYRGGFTYLNPKYAGKIIGKGLVLDVNSLYPSVMDQCYLPFGTGIYFSGKYEDNPIYPLYTQMIRCSFKIKEGKIPTIQIKYHGMFKGNEYLTSSQNEEVCLCLNNVDLELFFEQYDVYNLEYLSGWMFKATKGLFSDYIKKWSANKIKAKEEGNHGLYLISKLMLNSLYGKFGSNNLVISKIPYIEEGMVKYKDSEEQEKDPVYVAMASFITSYARLKTISSAQTIMDNYNKGLCPAEFVYADTDSLHIALNGMDEEEFLNTCGLDIHPTNLGAWDHEMSFNKGKYLRQKCYIENEIISQEDYFKGISPDERGNKPENWFLYNKDKNGYYKLKITVAGMPEHCYNQVDFNNFKIGASYTGKILPKVVPGGVVLEDVDFTIKAK